MELSVKAHEVINLVSEISPNILQEKIMIVDMQHILVVYSKCIYRFQRCGEWQVFLT